jgi:predicted HTH domain antitoxin
MGDVLLRIPETALETARITRDRLEPELLKELALQLYREGLVSSAGACQIAGLTKAEFQYILGEREVCQQLRVEDLEQELKAWDHWNKEKG